MRVAPAIVGFAAGCLATAVVARLVVDVSAQDDVIRVCVAADSTLQLALPTAACAPGQQTLQFKRPDQKPTQKEPSVDKGRIEALAARIKALEDAAAGGKLTNRVVAPFEVVDRAGKRVFYIEKQNDGVSVARLYNSSEIDVARIGATSGGGQFVGTAVGEGPAAYFGVFDGGKASGVTLRESDGTQSVVRTALGRDAATGRYFLKVFGADGNALAAIGQNRLNSGSAQVFDATGKPRVLLSVGENGKGVAQILNSAEKIVATLTEGMYGGQLLIFDSSGDAPPMVEAGVNDKGVGVVRAGPNQFVPGPGLRGLPASFISGRR